MAQERKHKVTSSATEDTVVDEPVAQDTSVSDDTDALLDEIDSVLEQDADQFVRQYVQKGGE